MTTTTLSFDTASQPFGLSAGFHRLCMAVLVVQGVHVIEHVIQLLQIHVWHTANTLGLLGYVLELHGTAEWMHLGFNITYLAALVVLAVGLQDRVQAGLLRARPFHAFLAFGVGLEGWHCVEHSVITYNMIRNGGGCPCPGILDPVLGVMDAQLHMAYNAVAYAGTLVPFIAIRAAARRR
jgi:hypothetical protein